MGKVNLSPGRVHWLWLMIGVVLLAALLRLPPLDRQSLGFDEGWSVAVGSADWPTLFQSTLSSGIHPPLFYVLNKTALWLWGTTEFGARFLTFICSLLTIPLVYQLGKLMFNYQTGLLAALLLAINPLHTWLAQEARMYSLLILLAASSMLFYWLALYTQQRRYWVGLTLVSMAAFNVHYFGLWLPVVQFIFILSNFGRYLRPFRAWAMTQFLAGLALLPWLIATVLRESQSFGVGFLKTPEFVDLPLTLWNFTIGYSLYFFWPMTVLWLILLAAVLLNGLRRNELPFRRAQMLLALWVFLPLLSVWLISQRRSFYADRYLSFVIPGLVLILAFGVARIKQSAWRAMVAGGLLMASGYGLVATNLDPAFQKDNWRGVVTHITQNEQSEDVILLYTTHIALPFNYYYQGNAPQKPLSFNLEQYPIEPLTKDHHRAWIVYPYTRWPTHYPRQPLLANGYWDQDPERNPRLVKWLATHRSNILDYQHFPGIQMWLVAVDAAASVRSQPQ